MRRVPLIASLALFMGVVCLPASAQYQRAFGWCEQGGQRAKTNGVQSSTYVQQSYVACTVTVFLTGTTTHATIFNDSAHTIPLDNPFTATSTGFWAFFAANGTYDVQFSGARITSPFSIAGYQLGSNGGGGGGTVGPGTANRLSKFTSSTTIGDSVCTDDGVNPTSCPGFSLSTNALFTVKPNNASTGTTVNLLVARDGTASQAVQNAQTTDVDNVIGIAGFGAGTSGSVSIAYSGQFPCLFDNQTAVGDWIILGTGSQCHDVGASQPSGIETIGRVNSVNAGAGTLAGVDLGLPDVTSTSTGGGTGVVSTVVCTGPLGTYTAPGNTITGDCNTSDDGAGNLSATSFTATGASAGFFASQQGTVPTLSAANANYFYANTSVVNTFGTAWPSAPGTLGQALVVTVVPDATHIELGYSSAGCAEGTCIVNTPTATQTITGAFGLTLSNAGSSFSVGGTATAGQIIDSGLTASLPVFTNGSKQLISGTQTGTGTQVVVSASPTMTGTTTVANLIDSGLTASLPVLTNGSKQLVSAAANIPSVFLCGTTTTCANTLQNTPLIVFGTVALSSGTPSTATVTALPFATTAAYVCTATDNTAASALFITNVSASSFTITGPNTVTDVIGYSCVGH